MEQEPHMIAADAVLPMDPALPRVLRDAGVVVHGGRILAVGELADLRRQFGELPAERDRVRGVLMPGLINAHTHLELSYQSSDAIKAGHFTKWVSQLIGTYPPPDQLEGVVRAAVRKGAAASLAAGVTLVGDISRHAGITRREFAAMHHTSPGSAPRIVSFGEVVGLGKMRHRAADMIAAASAPPPPEADPAILTVGISPHAPYTVEGPTLRACVRQAMIKRLPLTMHLAELAEETEFLRDLSGPLGHEWDLMLKMDVLDDQIPLMKGGPIRWARRWSLLLADGRSPGALAFPILLAHANHINHSELAQLAISRAAVAFCPRTHDYFGHPPHRFADMLAAEINVCLGTDSLASNPDLSVLREAQYVHEEYRTDPYTLLEMITWRSAPALGQGGNAGSMTPGKYADVILLPVAGAEDPAAQIVQQAPAPAAVWIAGQRVQHSI